jgi:predicted nucleotidyltransferase
LAAGIETVREDARRYVKEVRNHLPVDKAYLFGSYAKGTADELSDVDICFFLRDYGGKERADMGTLLLKIARDYKPYFEPMVFETADLEKDNPFVNEVLRTGQEID